MTAESEPKSTSESPPAMKRKNKVLGESSRYASLSLYSSPGVCCGHSQWHSGAAQLWAHPQGCFYILKSILFVPLFLNCFAVLLSAMVNNSYVPLLAWPWSHKGVCLFVFSCKNVSKNVFPYTHTYYCKEKQTKQTKTSQAGRKSWRNPTQKWGDTHNSQRAHVDASVFGKSFFATHPPYHNIKIVPVSQ